MINKKQKVEKKKEKTRTLLIVLAIIIPIILTFFTFYILFNLFPNFLNNSLGVPSYTITENVCHNETHTDWDRENLEVPISKINYTLPYSLGGLETTDFTTIFNFLNKENKFGEICQKKNLNCVYYRIKEGNFSLNEYKIIYGYENETDLEYSRINFINITGNNIRVDGESVRNLDGNHNDIFVTFEFNKFIIGTKTETIPVCEKKVVDSMPITKKVITEYSDGSIGTSYSNLLRKCNNTCDSYSISFTTNNVTLISIRTEYENISSKSLNKEWLSENCECIENTKGEPFPTEQFDNVNTFKDYCKEPFYSMDKEIRNNCICSIYSCIGGRYEVS